MKLFQCHSKHIR